MINKNDLPTDDILIGKVVQAWAENQNIRCHYFHKTGSTNNDAKQFLLEEKNTDAVELFLTEEQTSGKGRYHNGQQRIWLSPKMGSSLLSSWVFQSTHVPTPFLTAKLGINLHNALKSVWPFLDWNLKAPNDVFLKNKKIAGLLVETVSEGNKHHIIVGLGLNVFHSPKELDLSSNIARDLKTLNLPLLGDDFIQFLDRWLFEMTISISTAHEELTEVQKYSMLHQFNQSKLLTKPYIDFNQLQEDLWL